MRILAGDFLLVLNSASVEAQLALQLATHCGVRIIAVTESTRDAELVEKLSSSLQSPFVRIINLENDENVLEIVMEETGSLGVDYVLDYASCYQIIAEKSPITSMKRRQEQIIRCLRVHGTWISFTPVQLNPLESEVLLFKGVTIGFVFEEAWLLSSSHLGQYLHILQDLMKKLGSVLKGPTIETCSLKNIREAHQRLLSDQSIKCIINDFGQKQIESAK